MEPKPMTMWRGRCGVLPIRLEGTDEAVAVMPRAEYAALVKERDDWRDTSMAAYAAAYGFDWQNITDEQIAAMESDAKAHGDKKAMDCVRRLYAHARRLEAALRFYGDRANWHDCAPLALSSIETDGGAKARTALEDKP